MFDEMMNYWENVFTVMNSEH